MNLENYDIVLLYSGGLDSKLAGAILTKLGLKILSVKFLHPFSSGLWKSDDSLIRGEEPFDIFEKKLGDEYLEIIKKPHYGYGSNANPCLDCKIYFIKKAWEIAFQVNANGLATGDVLGQRPFSQRKEAMKLIEKQADVEGKIVRPLCAKLMPPSELEISGFIDREKLYAIKGRGRKNQIELAKEFGIDDYPSPAGGCLLTDPGYAKRFFDALEHDEITLETTQLLKFGRHFRIDGKKIIVGRNEYENEILTTHRSKKILSPVSIPGPTALIDADSSVKTEHICASIIARYCKKKRIENISVQILYPDGISQIISAPSADPIELDEYII
ncbi:hypothetical protein J7L68_04785 [bacterium]|nr:hypothetical protein [bacterium]